MKHARRLAKLEARCGAREIAGDVNAAHTFLSVDGGAAFAEVTPGKTKWHIHAGAQWTRADWATMQARGNEIVTIELPVNGR